MRCRPFIHLSDSKDAKSLLGMLDLYTLTSTEQLKRSAAYESLWVSKTCLSDHGKVLNDQDLVF
jgi:hypothetical protein